MKKTLKKIMAIAVAAVTAIGSFTVCAGASDSAAESVKVSADEVIKVGLITWSTTDALNVSVKRGFDMFQEDLGFEVYYEVFDGVDGMVDSAQNLIQSGCQVIVNILPSASLIDLCNKNGVYLVCWGNTVEDSDLQAILEASPYWVGTDSVSDYAAATDAMQTMYDNGARNFGVITQSTLNTNHSIRLQAIKEFVDNHEDTSIVSEIGITEANELSTGLSNMLSIYGDMDAIISTGSSNGWAEAVVATLEAEGVAGKVHYATIDWVDAAKDWFQQGYLDCISAGQYPDVMFDVINACNVARGAYEGNRVLDGCFLTINGLEGYEDYVKYVDADGVYPYSKEQLQSVCAYNNPDVTYEELYDLWAGYSMESVVEYWEAQ